MEDIQIGIIGAGHIGEAIIEGLVRSSRFRPDQIIASRRNRDAIEALGKKFGIAVTTDNHVCAQRSQVLIIAVRSDTVSTVLADLGSAIRSDHLILSVAAEISVAQVTRWSGTSRVARAMPTIAADRSKSLSAWVPHPSLGETDQRFIRFILDAIGSSIQLKSDREVDLSAAICGCAVGFLCAWLSLLVKEGAKLGFDETISYVLVGGALQGAISIASDGDSYDRAVTRVATPGGLTEAGLSAMERHGLPASIHAGVHAVAERILKGT